MEKANMSESDNIHDRYVAVLHRCWAAESTLADLKSELAWWRKIVGILLSEPRIQQTATLTEDGE